MIQSTKAYKTSDGSTFEAIEEAQKHELSILLTAVIGNNEEDWSPIAVLKAVMDNADKITDILTTRKGSKPAARAVNGGTKRRTKVAALPPPAAA